MVTGLVRDFVDLHAGGSGLRREVRVSRFIKSINVSDHFTVCLTVNGLALTVAVKHVST